MLEEVSSPSCSELGSRLGILRAWLHLGDPPSFARHQFTKSGRRRLKGTAAQRAGLRYEMKCHAYLKSLFPFSFHPSPWIQFDDGTPNVGWAQPDGLLNFPLFTVIIEIKARHQERAWTQLRMGYQPIVKVLFPEKETRVVEICQWLDPSIKIPEKVKILSRIEDIFDEDSYGVLTWRP